MNTTLTTITVPELTDSKYGENLQEQFENINSNFSLLSNYGINKGKDASGVKSITTNLNIYSNKKKQLKDKGKEYFNGKPKLEILELILCEFCHQTIQYYKTSIYKDYKFDNIKYKNPNITFLYTDINTEDLVKLQDLFIEFINIDYKELISYDTSSFNNILKKYLFEPLPYIYLDEDIYIDSFLNQSKSSDPNKTDKSGILILSNSLSLGELYEDTSLIACVVKFSCERYYCFPQIYYNTTRDEFCWIFGGQKTNFPIQGPPGKDGESGQIYMALFDSESDVPPTGSQPVKVTYVTQAGSWTSISQLKPETIDSMNNAMCLVRRNKSRGSTNIDNGCYWLGFLQVYKENGQDGLNVLISDQNKISIAEFKIGNDITLTKSNGNNDHQIFKDSNDDLMIQAGGENSNTLQINLDTTVTKNLTATGKLTANSGLDVTGKLTAKSGLDVTGKLIANNDLEVKGNLTTTSLTTTSLNATGKLTADNATVNGKLTVNNGLDVTGKLTANNDLDVTGNITADGNISAGGDIITKSGNISAGGTIEAKEMELTGKKGPKVTSADDRRVLLSNGDMTSKSPLVLYRVVSSTNSDSLGKIVFEWDDLLESYVGAFDVDSPYYVGDSMIRKTFEANGQYEQYDIKMIYTFVKDMVSGGTHVYIDRLIISNNNTNIVDFSPEEARHDYLSHGEVGVYETLANIFNPGTLEKYIDMGTVDTKYHEKINTDFTYNICIVYHNKYNDKYNKLFKIYIDFILLSTDNTISIKLRHLLSSNTDSTYNHSIYTQYIELS